MLLQVADSHGAQAVSRRIDCASLASADSYLFGNSCGQRVWCWFHYGIATSCRLRSRRAAQPETLPSDN